MISRAHVERVFALLEAGGCRPPRNFDSDKNLDLAINLWCVILADQTPEALFAAAVSFLRCEESSWWPTPGKFLSLVPGRQMDAIDDTAEAWAHVMKAIASRGRDRPPPKDWAPFSDPPKDEATRAALTVCGSWWTLCTLESSVLETSIRQSFRESYRGARQRQHLAQLDREARLLLQAAGERQVPLMLMEADQPEIRSNG